MSYNNNQAVPVIDLDGEHSGSEESFYAKNVRSEPQMDPSKQDSTNHLGHTVPNTPEQQYFHAEVDIIKTEDEEVKSVLKFICAFLNAKDANELIIRNKRYEVAITKHLDDWCSTLENKIRQCFSVDNPSDFVRLPHNNCNSEFLKFRISPANIFCSLSNFLYFPSITSNTEVRFNKAIEIMRKSGHPGDLFNIAKEKKYVYQEIVKGLRGENINIQFKNLTRDKILKETPKYISGFANNIGGSIFFGIEDKNGTVVGVDMTTTTEDDLINRLEGKVQRMIWVNSTNSIKRGEHWNVEFFPIEGLPEALNKMDFDGFGVIPEDGFNTIKYVVNSFAH